MEGELRGKWDKLLGLLKDVRDKTSMTWDEASAFEIPKNLD